MLIKSIILLTLIYVGVVVTCYYFGDRIRDYFGLPDREDVEVE